ncbi:aminodeoxychorismate synthase [Xylaria sp. CBS 124048]|nr:aminodeoxychorismate synthase [Xylaria sp. CBS 124048]
MIFQGDMVMYNIDNHKTPATLEYSGVGPRISPTSRVAMGRPRILFIDAYDSFSNNIVSLLTTVLEADVDILPIDPEHLNPNAPGFKDALRKQVKPYHAVVCGPGPGAPNVDKDVGIMKHIWDLDDQDLVPVLGICLGFQSLLVSCGALVKRLRTGLHGMIREIDHRSTPHDGNIFAAVPTFKATLYHSLHADIGQESIPPGQWPNAKWHTPPLLPDVVPLAWTYEDRGDAIERILMGVRHRTKPFWGLQYHPESICTETIGHQVIKNWFQEAMAWSDANSRNIESVSPQAKIPEGLEAPVMQSTRTTVKSCSDLGHNSYLSPFGSDARYFSRSLTIPLHIEVPDVVEILQDGRGEFIVLDSASAKIRRTGLDVRGRYSIVALDVDDALKLKYRTGESHIIGSGPRASSLGQEVEEKIELTPGQTIWDFLAEFWRKRQISRHETPETPETPDPFIGGFMGYTTYELGLEGIDVEVQDERPHSRPDLCFAWVTRSIVLDHLEGILRIQTLSSSETEGHDWMESIANKLMRSSIWSNAIPANFGKVDLNTQLTPPQTPTLTHTRTRISVPDASEYESKVRQCQDWIAAGDSYELCLTDQTLITQPRSRFEGTLEPSEKHTTPSSWQLYRSLRTRQPAPFGSYLRLGGATLVSSSPERFLTFNGKGLCSMRPMKGTVRKSPTVATLAAAEEILHVPKEEAENLMIVDLVRHDLHSVCGPGNVQVPHLLKVEEYASVFQMISIVEGQLPQRGPEEPQLTGLDVLAASLPPGSMTGAPKKRSCEILQGLEGPRGRERSLYSGVVGYMDAAGRGDWSVTIRSLFRWDDETFALSSAYDDVAAGLGEMETWHIGAGGAVTALSTPEGETDEMLTKLKGPLGVFEEA